MGIACQSIFTTTSQTLVLPPSPVGWRPENHLVLFLLVLAAELDLGEIHAAYPRGIRGGNKACPQHAAFRVLSGRSR